MPFCVKKKYYNRKYLVSFKCMRKWELILILVDCEMVMSMQSNNDSNHNDSGLVKIFVA